MHAADGVRAEPPAGWPPSAGIGYDIVLHAFECNHVSMGPFERGPILIVMEEHSNIDPPQACEEGQWRTLFALQSIWFSDNNLTLYARDALGMNAIDGSVQLKTEAVAGALVARWTWTPLGGKPSWLQNEWVDIPGDGGDPDIRRAAWAAGSGVAYINWQWRGLADWGTILIPQGEMHAPMLEADNDSYAGIGALTTETNLEGEVKFFADPECKEPI